MGQHYIRRVSRSSSTSACSVARALVLLAALLSAALPAAAAERGYSLRVPEGQPVSFQLEFAVEHPGTLGIRAEWSGARVLSFRLYGPGGHSHRARRSGPSPQRFEVAVDPRDVEDGRPWRLAIRALAARGGGEGLLTLELPEAPEVVALRELPPPPPPPPDPDPWMVARTAPAGAGEPVRHLFESIERLRSAVLREDGSPIPDSCRWHVDTLEWAGQWRDRYLERGALPSISTRRYLQRLVGAVRQVDEVRSSDDPILAGPPPGDRMRYRAWSAVRERRIGAVEHELDRLVDLLRGGHAPELENESWPTRLVSCLAACERHFEQRVRLGEREAQNAELAQAQWVPLTAAAEVLEALAFLPAPDGENLP